MEITPGLHRIARLDVEAVRREAEGIGYTTFVLPKEGVIDCASFFDAIRATFPLDPPVLSSDNWDALSDSLSEGLYTHPARRIAILWPGTRVMCGSALTDFEIALDVFEIIISSLAEPRFTCNSPKEIAVFVETETV